MKTIEMFSPLPDACPVPADAELRLSVPSPMASLPYLTVEVNGKVALSNGSLSAGWMFTHEPSRFGAGFHVGIKPIGGWPSHMVSVRAWVPRECRSHGLRFFVRGASTKIKPSSQPWGALHIASGQVKSRGKIVHEVPSHWRPLHVFNTCNDAGAIVWTHGAISSWGPGGRVVIDFDHNMLEHKTQVVGSHRGDRGFLVAALDADGYVTTITEASINSWDMPCEAIAICDGLLHASLTKQTAHLPIDYTPEPYEDYHSSWYVHDQERVGRALFYDEYMLWVCEQGILARHDWCPYTNLSREVWWPENHLDSSDDLRIVGRGKVMSGGTVWDTLECKSIAQ